MCNYVRVHGTIEFGILILPNPTIPFNQPARCLEYFAIAAETSNENLLAIVCVSNPLRWGDGDRSCSLSILVDDKQGDLAILRSTNCVGLHIRRRPGSRWQHGCALRKPAEGIHWHNRSGLRSPHCAIRRRRGSCRSSQRLDCISCNSDECRRCAYLHQHS